MTNTIRTPRRVALGVGAIMAVGAVALGQLGPQPAHADGNVLTVDASSVVRPVTHVGAGGLYALADGTTPDISTVLPLHPKQFTQPAPGVQQLGNGATTPTGDALKVAPTVTNSGGQQTVRMPDVYPDFPYKWVSWDDWLGKVDTMVKARLAQTSTTNINGWELWNEPDGTWDTNAAGPFNDGWTRTYREVKKFDTETPIVGPSIQSWNHDFMVSFLTQAKRDGTVPDVISWHLWNADALPGALADLRSIESSLGISPRPVSINEYAWPDQVDVPSASLRYLATFERNTDVRDAERAYWFESGTLNGLLHNGKPTGTYWLYKWYGDMTGNVVSTTQNGDQDGVTSLDATRKVLTSIVGGASGDNTVRVANLAGFGSNVAVTLQYTPSSGRQQNVAAPTTLWTKTLPVSNGTVSVPIAAQNASGAYEIVVTPTSGPVTSYQQTYEAENASIVNAHTVSSSGASNGSYVAGIDGSSDAQTDSFVDFVVNAPVAGPYGFSIRYANGGTATSTQGLAYGGGSWSTVSYPTTGGWGKFSTVTGPTLRLGQGYNVIRLAKGSPGFSGGSGFAELDSITLTSQNAVPAPTTPPTPTFSTTAEAENGTVANAQVLQSTSASNGAYVGRIDNNTGDHAKDSSVTVHVSVPTAGTYRLAIGYANGGTADATQGLSVNGGAYSTVTYPATGSWGSFGAVTSTTVSLRAGDNTIALAKGAVGFSGGTGYAELDALTVTSPAN